MFGSIVERMISTLFYTFIILVFIFALMFKLQEGRVNTVLFRTTNIVSTNGILSDTTYEELKFAMSRYGEFEYQFRLDVRLADGVYDTYYSEADIINRKLAIGDKVTIETRQINRPIIHNIINSPLFFTDNKIIDLFIHKSYTAMIENENHNLTKGYYVIADINNTAIDNNVSVFVSTLLNPSGKLYTNDVYGDDPDEIGATSLNYIFETGDFEKSEVVTGTLLQLNYTQIR